MTDIRCPLAVDKLEKRLDKLPHPEGMVRLVQFSHESPGLRKIRRQITEAVIMTLEEDFDLTERNVQASD